MMICSFIDFLGLLGRINMFCVVEVAEPFLVGLHYLCYGIKRLPL